MPRPLAATSVLTLALVLVACNAGRGDSDTAGETGGDDALTDDGGPTTGGPTSGPTTGDSSTADSTTGDSDTGDSSTAGPDPDPACGAPQTFEHGKVPSAEIHVTTDGTNEPSCGEPASPCASLAYAANLAVPGTAVVVHAGTYDGGGFIGGLSGTEAEPIWIGGAPGEDRPIIDGGGQGFQLSQARYVVIHDLEVRNSTQNGINVDDGGSYDDPDATRFLVFRDLYIHDVGTGGNEDCLKLSGIDDYWVLSSEFVRCGAGGSAVDHVGCHRGIIYGNHFHELGSNAIQCKGGAEDIEIRANLFEDAGQRGVNMGGSTGFEFFRPSLSTDSPNAEARDIRVIANVFRGGVTPFAFVGCVDCIAANNVIDSPTNWVFRILQETVSTDDYAFLPASNGRFVNNIVHFDAQVGTAVNVGANTDPDSFIIANNLWYRYDAPAQSDPPGGLPVPESDAIVGEDPRFVDIDGGNFALGRGSPAIGTGSTQAELGGDMDGVCFADPPSVGAYEAAPD
jgi:hypothetical protein